jgi:hypothetical protein
MSVIPALRRQKEEQEFQARLSEVAHFFNPSYVGGRMWEDHSSRPARAKSG